MKNATKLTSTITYKTAKMSAKEYAQQLKSESKVPCELIEVKKLPCDYHLQYNEAHNEYRCGGADNLAVFEKKGVAIETCMRVNKQNRAYGAELASQIIYFLTNFEFEVQVPETVTYEPVS